jgi:probable rRNA maturation factor
MTEGEFGAINPLLLGDILLSVETAARDAAAGGLDLMDEVEFLMIHGLLHLLGYEHENTAPEESRKMNARERELFFILRGYPII